MFWSLCLISFSSSILNSRFNNAIVYFRPRIWRARQRWKRRRRANASDRNSRSSLSNEEAAANIDAGSTSDTSELDRIIEPSADITDEIDFAYIEEELEELEGAADRIVAFDPDEASGHDDEGQQFG